MTPRGQPPAPPRAGERLELVALGGSHERLCARRLGSSRGLWVVPSSGSEPPLPAERFTLAVAESWREGARICLRGAISQVRLEVAGLGLEPLALVDLGPWDPGRDQLGGWPPEPAGRRELEMERIPPASPAAEAAEPLLERALELWRRRDRPAAEELLGALLRRDLRCLVAHSCLGFFAFDSPSRRCATERARRHYEAGLRIGELSLGVSPGRRFTGVLPWSRLGNRPFLRCLHGHATCLWRLGDLDGAGAGFERLCRLNPGDQLAARLALERIERRRG